MIDVHKAIEIFHDKIKGEYVGNVFDTGYSFIIVSVDEDGEYLDTAATEINKASGKLSAYLPFDDDNEKLDNAIKIDYTEIKHS